MSMLRQLPLFQDEPTRTEDIHKGTILKHTLRLFAGQLKLAGKSEHTITAFLADLRLLLEHQGDGVAVGAYQTGDLDAFLHWLEYERDVPCSRKSYARRVTTLKVYFKWLHGVKAIPYDPAKAVLQRSGPAPLSDALTMAQIRAALEFTRTLRLRKGGEQDMRPELLFWLLLDTGIKKGEAASILPAHIDRLNPRQPFLTVRYKVRNIFKARDIPLDPDWVKLLDLYLVQYTPKTLLFECTSRNLEYILTDIGAGAAIPFK
ncbi:MAG: site-specific integrase, partial [Armatimonadetes bacterium]|nr:site-specific integrase [Anaerolineae bacterium]